MYTKTDIESTSVHQTNSTAGAIFHGLDLGNLISILKNDKKYEKGEMNSMILLRNPSSSVVLAVMHERTMNRSRLNKNSVNFQIVGGQVKIDSPKERAHHLRNEDTFTLSESKFRINSITVTTLLITMNSK